MIHFGSDYRQSAHKRVLEALIRHQDESHGGYGEDSWCQRAEARVREMTGRQDAALHFVPGGTQANLTVISSALRPHQGVVAVDSGHINAHETGAIEATGHKVLCLPHDAGKMRPEDLAALCQGYLDDPSFEHIVQPRMVYLSQSTEWGTVYTKAELREIKAVCQRYGLLLYVDGARLGYAMAALGSDMDIQGLSKIADVFTIGLTKQGALFGEAIVIVAPDLQKDFRSIIKQKGGMMAKGWLMGLQFEALFEDDLYMSLSRQAIRQAMRLKEGLTQLGVPFYIDSPSNQQFPILPDEALDRLRGDFGWSPMMGLPDGRQVVRFCTSWATNDQDVEALLAAMARAL